MKYLVLCVLSLRLAGVEKTMELKVMLLHIGQGKLLAPSIDKSRDMNTDKSTDNSTDKRADKSTDKK